MTPMDGAVPLAAPSGWAELRSALARFVEKRVAPSEVDDLVQEIVVALARTAPRGEERTPALAYTIARRTVAGHHRRRAREHARLARLAEEPDDPGGEPLTSVEERVASALALFLETLPPHHRDAVRAVDVDGRAQSDVARELGIPLSTLRTRVQRGRRELRATLKRCCEIELDARGQVVSCEPRAGGCAVDC